MTYEVREDAAREAKWGTNYPSCLPSEKTIQQLYSSGYSLYHMGKRLSKTAALKHRKEAR